MDNPTDGFSFVVRRPSWWWINPWLYAMRRDRAYEAAIDSLYFYCKIGDLGKAAPEPKRPDEMWVWDDGLYLKGGDS